MSLQRTVDSIRKKSQIKVDDYNHRSGALAKQTLKNREAASNCEFRLKGLEKKISECNDMYDHDKGTFRCFTTESRSSLEQEIQELEATLKSNSTRKLNRPVNSWQSLGNMPLDDRGGFYEPFFDNDSKCTDHKMFCRWIGKDQPMPMGRNLDMNYLDQGNTYLECEARKENQKHLIVPRTKMQRTKSENPGAVVLDWEDALNAYGNARIYTSLINGVCDI